MKVRGKWADSQVLGLIKMIHYLQLLFDGVSSWVNVCWACMCHRLASEPAPFLEACARTFFSSSNSWNRFFFAIRPKLWPKKENWEELQDGSLWLHQMFFVSVCSSGVCLLVIKACRFGGAQCSDFHWLPSSYTSSQRLQQTPLIVSLPLWRPVSSGHMTLDLSTWACFFFTAAPQF